MASFEIAHYHIHLLLLTPTEFMRNCCHGHHGPTNMSIIILKNIYSPDFLVYIRMLGRFRPEINTDFNQSTCACLPLITHTYSVTAYGSGAATKQAKKRDFLPLPLMLSQQ